MDIKIRPASLSDLDELIHWRIEALREVFSLPDGDANAALQQASLDYYRAELAARRHIACFAEQAGAVIGCGGLCLHAELPSPDNPSGKCGYLMNIYTQPESRRKGAGAAVVTWLTAQAERRGVGKLYLETTEDGRALYRQLGFSDMIDYMIKTR